MRCDTHSRTCEHTHPHTHMSTHVSHECHEYILEKLRLFHKAALEMIPVLQILLVHEWMGKKGWLTLPIVNISNVDCIKVYISRHYTDTTHKCRGSQRKHTHTHTYTIHGQHIVLKGYANPHIHAHILPVLCYYLRVCKAFSPKTQWCPKAIGCSRTLVLSLWIANAAAATHTSFEVTKTEMKLAFHEKKTKPALLFFLRRWHWSILGFQCNLK